jgi:hypothetical protein
MIMMNLLEARRIMLPGYILEKMATTGIGLNLKESRS